MGNLSIKEIYCIYRVNIVITQLGNRLLADEAVVFVIGVVLGVPGEVGVEVHVKPRVARWFILLETKNILLKDIKYK